VSIPANFSQNRVEQSSYEKCSAWAQKTIDAKVSKTATIFQQIAHFFCYLLSSQYRQGYAWKATSLQNVPASEIQQRQGSCRSSKQQSPICTQKVGEEVASLQNTPASETQQIQKSPRSHKQREQGSICIQRIGKQVTLTISGSASLQDINKRLKSESVVGSVTLQNRAFLSKDSALVDTLISKKTSKLVFVRCKLERPFIEKLCSSYREKSSLTQKLQTK